MLKYLKYLAIASAAAFIAGFAGFGLGQNSMLTELTFYQTELTSYQEATERSRERTSEAYGLFCKGPQEQGGLSLWAVERSFGSTQTFNEFCRMTKSALTALDHKTFITRMEEIDDFILSLYEF